jgi:hypothetical protein
VIVLACSFIGKSIGRKIDCQQGTRRIIWTGAGALIAGDGGHREAKHMSRKHLTSLAPMLALAAMAALAAMPALAQAAPHYYKSGVLIPEGEKVPVLEWGKLTLSPEPPAGFLSCENLAGGYVENPVGGGAGIGATLRFVTYNCSELECPAGEIEVGGKKYEKEFEIVYPPQSFPWPSVLNETEPGIVRTSSGGVVMELSCVAHKLTRAEAGEGGSKGAGENEQYVLPSGGPPTVTCVADGTHKWAPQNGNGSNSGPGQSKLVFNAGSGLLTCAGGAFESKTKEALHIMGFKNSELITVH